MSKTVITLIVGVLLGFAGSWFLSATSQAEPEPQLESAAASILPDLPAPYYKVLFENDAVRVVEHRLETGDTEPEHTHPPMVAYFVPVTQPYKPTWPRRWRRTSRSLKGSDTRSKK